MRETVIVLRRLLNMERVTFHGEFVHVEGIELDVVHGRREPRNVPIMIGATGDQMMELTGEIADGAVLNYCVPPEYNIRALELLEKGQKRQGVHWMTWIVHNWWFVPLTMTGKKQLIQQGNC